MLLLVHAYMCVRENHITPPSLRSSPGLFAAGAAVSKAGVLGPASLARLVTSLARLNQRPQHKLLAAFASSSVGKLGLLELNELSACGSALADLQFVPPPAWSQAFLSATHTQLRQLAMQAQSGERSGSEGSGSESSFVMQGSSTVSLRQSGATIQSAGARASYGSTAGPATIDASSRPLGSAVDAGGPSTIDSLSELLCAAAKLPLQLRDDWLEDFMLASQPLLQHARPAARAKLLWASVVLDLPGQTRGSLMHSLGRAFVQLLLADAQIGSLQGAQGADQKSKSEKKQTAQQQPRKQSTKQSGRQGRAPAQHGAQRTGVSPRQVPEPLVPCGAFLATSTSVPSPPWIETPGTVRSSSSKSSSPLLPAAAAPLVLRPHRFKMRQRAQPGE